MPNPTPSDAQSKEYNKLIDIYSDDWYKTQVDESYESAKVYVDYLSKYIQPDSVLDVGCGRGAWLKAWKEKGVPTLIGYDGSWNRKENMIDNAIEFVQIDLNKPFSTRLKVDLCMSLEVAEHLEPPAAKFFIENLTNISDMILFGAAYTGQGGTKHINEQPHTYWAKYFDFFGYAPFDILRPVFWSDERVCYWYRQNTFLYVRKNSESFNKIILKNLNPLPNISFMNCIHPHLYKSKLEIDDSFKTHLSRLFPSFIQAIRRRMM